MHTKILYLVSYSGWKGYIQLKLTRNLPYMLVPIKLFFKVILLEIFLRIPEGIR